MKTINKVQTAAAGFAAAAGTERLRRTANSDTSAGRLEDIEYG